MSIGFAGGLTMEGEAALGLLLFFANN